MHGSLRRASDGSKKAALAGLVAEDIPDADGFLARNAADIHLDASCASSRMAEISSSPSRTEGAHCWMHSSLWIFPMFRRSK
jgi:hypothetical protein